MVNHQKLVALLSDQEKCFELLILCHTVVMEERHSLNQIANELGIPTYQVIPLISPAALIAELLIVLADREYESPQTAGRQRAVPVANYLSPSARISRRS